MKKAKTTAKAKFTTKIEKLAFLALGMIAEERVPITERRITNERAAARQNRG